MTLFLALLAGGLLGFVLQRGDLCFHSTWRGLRAKPPTTDLFRAYLFLLVLSVPAVQGMRRLGLIDPWIPPLVWKANLLGGLVFGLGMVIARTCVTGMFYKLGHGMLGAALAIVGWSVGDLIAFRGPLSALRANLNSDPLTTAGATATASNIAGVAGPAIVAVLLAVAVAYLWGHRSEADARRVLATGARTCRCQSLRRRCHGMAGPS